MKQGFRGIVGIVIDTSQILISQIVVIRSVAYLSGGSKIFKPHEIEKYIWLGGLVVTTPPPPPRN